MDERGERPAKMNGFPKIMIRNDGAGTGIARRLPGKTRRGSAFSDVGVIHYAVIRVPVLP